MPGKYSHYEVHNLEYEENKKNKVEVNGNRDREEKEDTTTWSQEAQNVSAVPQYYDMHF